MIPTSLIILAVSLILGVATGTVSLEDICKSPLADQFTGQPVVSDHRSISYESSRDTVRHMPTVP